MQRHVCLFSLNKQAKIKPKELLICFHRGAQKMNYSPPPDTPSEPFGVFQTQIFSLDVPKGEVHTVERKQNWAPSISYIPESVSVSECVCVPESTLRKFDSVCVCSCVA